MDTGAGATHEGNGKSVPPPHDQSAVSPGPGAAVPAPTNGKHHPVNGTAAAAPGEKKQAVRDPKTGRILSGSGNPGGRPKVSNKRLNTAQRNTQWLLIDGTYWPARNVGTKKSPKWEKDPGPWSSEVTDLMVAKNSKDGRVTAKLMDKLYLDGTPNAALVQMIQQAIPVASAANDGRRNTPQLADPAVRQSILGLINALDDAGGYSGHAGEARN